VFWPKILLWLLTGMLVETTAGEPHVSIRIDDQSAVAFADTNNAVSILLALLRSSSVIADVEICSHQFSCSNQLAHNQVAIKIRPKKLTSYPHQLGQAFQVGTRGCLATIYAPAVVEPADRAGVPRSAVLGYTLVHEVSHLLGLSHAPSGVMKEGLDVSDYRKMPSGDLRFSEEARQLIWAGALGRAGKDTAVSRPLIFLPVTP